MSRKLSKGGDPGGGGDTSGRGQPPKVPCGGTSPAPGAEGGNCLAPPGGASAFPSSIQTAARLRATLSDPATPGTAPRRRAEAEKGGPGRDLARRIGGTLARPGGKGAAKRGDGAEPERPVHPPAAVAAAGGGKCSDLRALAKKAPLSPRWDSAGPNVRRASRVGARSITLSP